MNKSTHQRFNIQFAMINKTVDFNQEWKNGTGYLDGVVKADLGLGPGDMCKCIDDFNRKVIIIGTRFGNVVVFERYKDEERIVSNVPSRLRKMGLDNVVTSHEYNLIFSHNDYPENIGEKLEDYAKMFA